MDLSRNPPQDDENAWYWKLKERIAERNILSPRNPTIATDFSTADILERHLQDDGHRKWGFVIYRCTYDNEDNWTEFLRRLRFRTEETLAFYGGHDLLQSFETTVMDDRTLFDGASTDTIRHHFQHWSLTAYEHEQRPETNTDEAKTSVIVHMGRSARYRFAVQVDAESLYSVLYDALAPPELDPKTKGWVKLIDKTWYLGRGGSTSRDRDEFEAIEGLTLQDVGWMKTPYDDLMTECYAECRFPNFWALSYRRPSIVAGSRT